MVVDVSGKEVQLRIAEAEGSIYIKPEIIQLIKEKKIHKGDIYETSRVAGILAIKQTDKILPFCHPLSVDNVEFEFELKEEGYLKVKCRVKAKERTGVEMEALLGVAVALLNIYDMCKKYDSQMKISNIRLIKKEKV